MAKEFYMRTIVAGRYRKVARYTRALPGDSGSVRSAKTAATNSAQHYINIKNSTEKLQWLLCANFDRKDACFLTFTFRDGDLPASRREATERFARYRRKLARDFSRRGGDFRSIYVVEGDAGVGSEQVSQTWEVSPWRDRRKWEGLDEEHGQEEAPTRLHVHCFLLLRREDYDTVRSLWPWGHVFISPMKVNELSTFRRLAAYVTKEARAGKLRPGERSYIPSQSLEQPQTSGHWCSEFEGITVPAEASEISRGGESNREFGASMEYVFYRMPRPVQEVSPYKSRGRLKNRQNGK